ncbi:hypothetical protein JXB02_02830 [Candidatus Woesearchaeota archaeon]|nr:hypothetical protein [Candidatus Woesearchaeota archaeon]
MSKAVALLAIALLAAPAAAAVPPIAMEIYGGITIDGEDAIEGILVEAYGEDGRLCGRFVVEVPGKYGLLSCNADDPDTEEDEGASPGEAIVFRINRQAAVAERQVLFEAGEFAEVRLAASLPDGQQPFMEVPADDEGGAPWKTIFVAIIVVLALIVWNKRLELRIKDLTRKRE